MEKQKKEIKSGLIVSYVSKTGSKKSNVKHEGGHKRVLQGIVTSDKMQKTIVVMVNNRIKHAQYKKYITLSQKYKAHDEQEVASIGDRVEIIESRPLSKDKRWALRKILEQASLKAGEA